MRAGIWRLWVVLLLLSAGAAAVADGEPAAQRSAAGGTVGEATVAEVTVADLDWLAGHWVGEKDGAVIEEHWSTPGGGTMMGMFRWIRPAQEDAPPGANRVALYEFFVVEPGPDDRPVLHLRHFDPGLDAWEDRDAAMEFRLVVSGERRVAFEAEGGDGPVWLGFHVPEPGVLVATLVEGDGETEFRYARVGG